MNNKRTAVSLPKITQQSLAWLACPACRSRLELRATAETTIHCTGCAWEFKIADGLPVLLP